MLRASIQPLHCWLRTEYLYNMQERKPKQIKVTIIGVASYPGDVLTFDIIVDSNGAMFHYIPPSALAMIPGGVAVPLNETVYHDCPDNEIAVTKLQELSKIDKCYVWLCEVFHPAYYHFTVDWYNYNLLLHVVSLEETGQIMAWPSHKIIFSHAKPQLLPDYLKLRQKWQVGRLK